MLILLNSAQSQSLDLYTTGLTTAPPIMSSPNNFGQLGLSILGLGTQYPPYNLKPDAVDTLAKRFHNADGDAMRKVLSINRFTGIEVSLKSWSVCSYVSKLTLFLQDSLLDR